MHSLTYTGISYKDLIAAAKYDPPTPTLVAALAAAFEEALTDWEFEVSDMMREIETKDGQIATLEDKLENGEI